MGEAGGPKLAACPDCGTVSAHVKGYVITCPADLRQGQVGVVQVKRRLECREPSCPSKTFTEAAAAVLPRCRGRSGCVSTRRAWSLIGGARWRRRHASAACPGPWCMPRSPPALENHHPGRESRRRRRRRGAAGIRRRRANSDSPRTGKGPVARQARPKGASGVPDGSDAIQPRPGTPGTLPAALAACSQAQPLGRAIVHSAAGHGEGERPSRIRRAEPAYTWPTASELSEVGTYLARSVHDPGSGICESASPSGSTATTCGPVWRL